MKRFLYVLIAVLVVAAGAGLFALRGALDVLETRTAAMLQKKGWQIAFNEKAELRPLSVRYRDIRLTRIASDDFVDVGSVKVRLALLPLLQRRVSIRKAVFSDVQLSVYGRTGRLDVLKLMRKRENLTVAGRAEIIDYTMNINGVVSEENFDFDIKGDGLFAALTGKKTGGKVEATAKVSATKTPIPQSPDLALAARVELNGAVADVPSFTLSLGGNGNVLLKASGEYVDGTLSADMEGTLRDAAGVPLAYAGKIKTGKSGTFIDKMTVSGGQTSFMLSAYRTDGDFGVDLTSSVIDLSQLSPVKKEALLPLLPVLAQKENAAFVQTLKTADWFNPSTLRKINGRLDVSVGKLIAADGQDLGAVKAKASLKNGVLSVPAAQMGAFFAGTATADASDGKTVKASVALKLNAFPAALLEHAVKSGTIGGKVALTGTGTSRSEVAGSLNGTVSLLAKNVRIEPKVPARMPKVLKSLFGDFDRPTAVSCAVVNVPFKNGVMTTDKRIGFESDKLDFQLNGTADYSRRIVDLNAAVFPKNGGVVTALLSGMSITGDMDNPTVRLDSENSLQNALSYGLAFLQGGKNAARQVLQSRRQELKDVCKTALRR